MSELLQILYILLLFCSWKQMFFWRVLVLKSVFDNRCLLPDEDCKLYIRSFAQISAEWVKLNQLLWSDGFSHLKADLDFIFNSLLQNKGLLLKGFQVSCYKAKRGKRHRQLYLVHHSHNDADRDQKESKSNSSTSIFNEGCIIIKTKTLTGKWTYFILLYLFLWLFDCVYILCI